uniref:Kinase n=1 Tax=Haptolina brevifila TaxID=156173 RepID=A0A7S2BN26_9EUKA|eukprot:CAMPEP_0174719348 /NCGR_PEP_ID=MMETSP1094-20130205/30926_1 /TAXON_ID=156173 /ORGANISM="Chrysochromulina brevifilum, Strain UTEX LB 985" /LENGTH=469 /DNA_ID=CAMNT_0015919631 /DNA_START=36 /DNA_END=1445 /DNA_ORIENTATION=+
MATLTDASSNEPFITLRGLRQQSRSTDAINDASNRGSRTLIDRLLHMRSYHSDEGFGSNRSLMTEYSVRCSELSISSPQMRGDTLPKTLAVQASGHNAAFNVLPNGALLKRTTSRELRVFESIAGTPLAALCPHFYGVREPEGNTPNKAGDELHVIMQDLTAGMSAPCVMDIKMGTRTFLEREVESTKLRDDLVEKMIALDPSSVTEAEQHQGVTKLRYMTFREQSSSSATHGWRIDGLRISHSEGKPRGIDTKRHRTDEQLGKAIGAFLQGNTAVHQACLQRLCEMRAVLEGSELYHRMEIIGSSLLFVYDAADPAARGSVHMIDFAKTSPVPCGGIITHTAGWVMGNHEDGHLAGLNSLIQLWERIGVGMDRAERNPAARTGTLGRKPESDEISERSLERSANATMPSPRSARRARQAAHNLLSLPQEISHHWTPSLRRQDAASELDVQLPKLLRRQDASCELESPP